MPLTTTLVDSCSLHFEAAESSTVTGDRPHCRIDMVLLVGEQCYVFGRVVTSTTMSLIAIAKCQNVHVRLQK
jgi:hypothetical protein